MEPTVESLQKRIIEMEREHDLALNSLEAFHTANLEHFKSTVQASIIMMSPKYGPADEAVKRLTVMERRLLDLQIQNDLAETILNGAIASGLSPKRIQALLKVRQKVADDRAKGPSKRLGGYFPWTPRSIADLELYATEQF